MNGALEEGTTVKIGATLVEGTTLKIIGEWCTTMPSLLEPSSNSIDSTGIEKRYGRWPVLPRSVPYGKHTAHN